MEVFTKMKKRILHIIIRSSYDGAAVSPVRLCLHMKEFDHEIISCYKGNAFEEILNLGIECENLLNVSDVSYKYLLFKYWSFFKYLNNRSFDIIHYHQGGIGLLLLAYLFRKNAKVIHHLHSGNLIGDNKKESISCLHKLVLKFLENRTKKIAVAKHVFEKYRKQINNNSRLTVIENAVPFNFKKKNELTFGIGYLGRVTPVKGFSIFKNLIFKQELTKWKLKFYAMGDITPAYLLDNLEQNLIEFVSPSFNISDFFVKIDLLIFPSKAPEGLPLTLLEAASFDVGIIAPDNEAFREVLDDYPLLISENTMKEIIQKIDFYYSGMIDQEELSKIHKDICLKYEYSEMVMKIDKIYKSLLINNK
jgi:glycosyltransferase involved in cell wall biosynthesis